MRAKKIVAGLVVTVALAVGLIPSLLQFVAQRYIGTLSSRDFRLTAREIEGHFVGISASSVELWIPLRLDSQSGAIPLSIQLQNVSVSIRAPLFPPRMPTVMFSANAYQGSISGELSELGRSPRLSLKLSGLALSDHPQLLALGITSGSLSCSAQGITLNSDQIKPASGEADIENLAFAPPPLVSRVTRISSVSNLNAHISAVVRDNGTFSIQPMVIDSSLASIQGRATGRIQRQDLTSLQSIVQVRLRGSEGQSLAQWLPILSNNSLTSENSDFSISSRTSACTAHTPSLIRVGSVCLANSFSPT